MNKNDISVNFVQRYRRLVEGYMMDIGKRTVKEVWNSISKEDLEHELTNKQK